MPKNNNIPLSLYIHIPWCVKKCNYCDFNSYPCEQPILEQNYLHALIDDLQENSQHLKFHSIFIGGGTPTILSTDFYRQLLEQIAPATNTEITIEANPDTINLTQLKTLLALGINRLSLGIQSFQDDKLTALGRIHDAQTAEAAVKTAQDAGYDNINLDLMFGLPHQTLAAALADLETAMALQPTHLSWYQLTIEPNTPFYQQPPPVPTEDTIIQIWQRGQKLINSQGFEHYEISAYSKPNRRCHHNLNYWQFGDYLGIGAGAHSKITDQEKITRTSRTLTPHQYMQQSFIATTTQLTQQQIILEFMLNALRLYQPIPTRLFTARTKIALSAIKAQLNEAESQGLLKWNEQHIATSAKGKRMLNNLLGIFT